jgi:hypothetical protein
LAFLTSVYNSKVGVGKHLASAAYTEWCENCKMGCHNPFSTFPLSMLLGMPKKQGQLKLNKVSSVPKVQGTEGDTWTYGELTEDWRKLHNVKNHYLYLYSDISWEFKLRRNRLAGHVPG